MSCPRWQTPVMCVTKFGCSLRRMFSACGEELAAATWLALEDVRLEHYATAHNMHFRRRKP